MVNHRRRISRVKQQCVAAIKKKTEPLFHDSGYVGKDDKPFQLVILKREREPKGYYNVECIMGFSEGGLITDAWVGLVTVDYYELCVEDLLKLRRFVDGLTLEDFKLSKREAA